MEGKRRQNLRNKDWYHDNISFISSLPFAHRKESIYFSIRLRRGWVREPLSLKGKWSKRRASILHIGYEGMSIYCTRSELRTEDEDVQQLRAAGNLCGLLIVHRLGRNQTDEFRPLPHPQLGRHVEE